MTLASSNAGTPTWIGRERTALTEIPAQSSNYSHFSCTYYRG
uniref:Uncharacterized protein n=1 Tax=Actinobacteria phage HS02 TaxID=3056388 RepID=A0AA49X1X4_9VIRU|nr:MAG: hypothetical protein [Actinobacteria phage HS02]